MKPTIAILEKELSLEKEKVNELVRRAELAEKRDAANHQTIEHERNSAIQAEKRSAILAGRCTELLAAHDILLRQSLRASGMAWEDIDRTIHQSRGNFGPEIEIRNTSSCGCDSCRGNSRGGIAAFGRGY